MRYTDETEHLVALSRGFWMEKFLVTQGHYLAVGPKAQIQFKILSESGARGVSWPWQDWVS
nr:hypothetical protein Hi04_10k_c5218_00003 [uncultured bacterium]